MQIKDIFHKRGWEESSESISFEPLGSHDSVESWLKESAGFEMLLVRPWLMNCELIHRLGGNRQFNTWRSVERVV